MKKKQKKSNYIKRNRLVLSYTEREWSIIDRAISKSGNRNGVISHIIKGINNLDVPLDIEVGEKYSTKIKRREYYPPDNSFEVLTKVAEKTNLRPSTIVSRLIINPLLLEK